MEQPAPAAAVVFDMDGLLFDSETLYRDALFAVARERGFALEQADFLSLLGHPWTRNSVTLQRILGPQHDVEAVRIAWMEQFERLRPRLALKPGVRELLARLDELRLPRAICTSSSAGTVAFNLDLHGLRPRFDAVVASGDYARGKPDPEPYAKAAQRLGIAPGLCLALEDSAAGVRSAQAAGLRVVMVPDLLQPEAALLGLCEAVVADLHAVRDRWFGEDRRG